MARLVTGITIDIDEQEYQRVHSLLRGVPNGAKIACSRAINRTLNSARTQISRRLAAEMTAKKSAIDRRMRMVLSTRENLIGLIRIKDNKGVAMIGFGARQNKRGVSVRIFGKQSQLDHAFIARGINNTKGAGPNEAGNRHVFERHGEKRAMTAGRYAGSSVFAKHQRGPRKGQPILRQPIRAMYGPSAAETFRKTPGLLEEAFAEVRTNLQKNLKSQIDLLLERGAPK